MYFSTAPSLLLGLGARIFIDKFITTREASTQDYILFGVWQGVALYYSFTKSPELSLIIAFLIGAKLIIDYSYSYSVTQDVTQFASTLLGVLFGVVCTDVLSQFLDGFFDGQRSPDSRPSKLPHDHKKQRSVQFRNGLPGDGVDERRPALFRQTYSDITSVDSSSDLIGRQPSMSPLDREVAALRARASLADSERRRCKEEKKWALSQGNRARASQMSTQAKRYTALMQSFHREADARIIEASNLRARQEAESQQRGNGRARTTEAEPQQRTSTRERTSRSQGHEYVIDRRPGVSVDIGPQHREHSGNLKSAIRVHVRTVKHGFMAPGASPHSANGGMN